MLSEFASLYCWQCGGAEPPSPPHTHRMKPLHVLACLALGLAVAQAGVLPEKTSLSIKNKLALDLPVKQHHAKEKTESKAEVVKVVFQSTTTSSTTTPEPEKSTERPQYVDATIFRHQFTTPAGFVTKLEPLDDVVGPSPDFEAPSFDDRADYEAHFRLWEDVSGFAGELASSGRDLRAESYIGGYRPLAF
ncbi:uncharacterized protein [Panulirus ornatus]|uniref:uncharacterized protein n=1 Tax=Panulirus ornatus TaxID=150431 RepID=UPI003A857429